MGSSYVGGGSDAICVAEWSSDEICISFEIFMHNLNCVAYFTRDFKYINVSELGTSRCGCGCVCVCVLYV